MFVAHWSWLVVEFIFCGGFSAGVDVFGGDLIFAGKFSEVVGTV
jgi:hypothetical protein